MADNPRWHLQRQITLGVLIAILVQTSGALIWAAFEGKKCPSNGQYQISFNKLGQLQAQVEPMMR